MRTLTEAANTCPEDAALYAAGVRLSYEQRANIREDFKDAHAYRVRISYKGRSLSGMYYKGYGHNGKAPKLAEVVDGYTLDAQAGEAPTFAEFAEEYGYDEDSRSAEKTYKACQKARKDVTRLFAGDLAHVRELLQDY